MDNSVGAKEGVIGCEDELREVEIWTSISVEVKRGEEEGRGRVDVRG